LDAAPDAAFIQYVVEGVGPWFDEAIPKARTAEEMNLDPSTDYDLAGR
jgi:hypothetical protein